MREERPCPEDMDDHYRGSVRKSKEKRGVEDWKIVRHSRRKFGEKEGLADQPVIRNTRGRNNEESRRRKLGKLFAGLNELRGVPFGKNDRLTAGAVEGGRNRFSLAGTLGAHSAHRSIPHHWTGVHDYRHSNRMDNKHDQEKGSKETIFEYLHHQDQDNIL
jgi:hypothetical protein